MMRTPKNASSASIGTTTYGVRNRSSSRLDVTKPTAPPACWSELASPSSGCGLPLAMCTMPRIPSAKADQPMTWRPAGPLRSGSRRVRHPAYTRKSGTSQPTLPTAPAVIERMKSMTPPGSCHQTAAATTMARPMTNSPAPSRRCSGSRSRADCPTERATAPRAWAMPSQTEATARPTPPKPRATGPGPLRTARGAGRFAVLRAGAREPPLLVRAAGLLEVLRDRVFEDEVPPRELPRDLVEPDVLELRDPGGEDVRVAMPRPYGRVTPAPRITGSVSHLA